MADPGEGPARVALPTLFLDQAEVPKSRKRIFFETGSPPYLMQGVDDRPPLSEGPDPPL